MCLFAFTSRVHHKHAHGLLVRIVVGKVIMLLTVTTRNPYVFTARITEVPGSPCTVLKCTNVLPAPTMIPLCEVTYGHVDLENTTIRKVYEV